MQRDRPCAHGKPMGAICDAIGRQYTASRCTHTTEVMDFWPRSGADLTRICNQRRARPCLHSAGLSAWIKRLDEESRALQRGVRRGRWADRHCLPVAPATIWLPAPWSILRARALLYRHQTGTGIRRKLHICHGWQVQLRLAGSRISDARPCAFVERISYRW